MIACTPVTQDGNIDPRWGRANWIAIADIVDGQIRNWREVEVSWNLLHDEGTEGSHHARVAKFLRENGVESVIAHHMGDGMTRMLNTMGIEVHLGVSGDARAAVQSVTS